VRRLPGPPWLPGSWGLLDPSWLPGFLGHGESHATYILLPFPFEIEHPGFATDFSGFFISFYKKKCKISAVSF